MKRILTPVLIGLLAGIAGWFAGKNKNAQSNQAFTSNDHQLIHELIFKQQESWNKGDLPGFMQGYINSDSLLFISKNGIRKGFNATLSAYQKAYPTDSAMGTLTFKLDRIAPIENGSQSAMACGKWNLGGTAKPAEGYFSLLLKRSGDDWKIIADHTW